MTRFFEVYRTQSMFNVGKIIDIYRAGDVWGVTLDGNRTYTLTEEEYGRLRTMIKETEEEFAEKKEERQFRRHYRDNRMKNEPPMD